MSPNNRWFGRPRLFGLLLAVGFSAVVWVLIYLAVNGLPQPQPQPQPAASNPSTVKVQPQPDPGSAPAPVTDAVRTE